MKSNKMFVALVAMLWSFALSASEQVTNETELKAALAAGGEVVLGADITVSETIEIPTNVTATLDLNGKTVAHQDEANKYAINNLGSLTIKSTQGNGSINARGIYNGYGNGGANVATAKITVLSGTINAKGTNGGAAIFNYGSADIQGGNFTSIGGYSLNCQSGASMTIADGITANNGIYVSGATLVVNGGEISGNRSGCHVLYAWNSDVTINGGTFHNYNSGNSTTMAGGTTKLTINGGTFTIANGKSTKGWTSCLIDATDGGKYEINGGEFKGHFRVQANCAMEINGGTFENTHGEAYAIYGTAVVKGGTFTDDAAKTFADKYLAENFKLGEDGKVVSTYAVKIGEQGYATLDEAITAAQNGDEIVLTADVKTTDGVVITDKNLTIDLNGKTYTVTEGASTNNRNFKINGTSVVTVKNGTMVAAGEYSSGAYGTIRTEGTANVTLTGLKLYNYRGNGLNIKACAGTTVTIENTEIYANYGGGIESAGGTIVVNNGVIVEQKGMYTAPYNSMAISVNGGGKVTVNGGTFSTECITAEEADNQGTSHGPWVAGVLNSGGTLIINGGTFSNDNFGENSLATAARGAILADTKAKVEIYGGTFNVLKNVIDIQNNLGDTNNNPSVLLVGGTYSADPRISAQYGSNLITLADDCSVKEENNRFIVVKEGLTGAGAEANPYLIKTVEDLILFRNSVNAGETKYNAEGKYVALGANIDLAGQDWSVNIGDDCNATFDGIFDGKGFTISNLTSTETAKKADGYICTGLFGAIAGNAVVKNLTIENVTIDAQYVGNNVGAVVGFAWEASGSIENVTVTGDININASAVTGVGAILGYDYACKSLEIKDCKVIGTEGSSIVGGKAYVGGVVGYASSKIALNGNTVENVTVTGTASVGAIAGIMLVGSSAADNTVKSVAVSATGELWANSAAVVAGTMTSDGTVTISNTTVENVTINGTEFDDNEEDAYASVIVGGKLVEQPKEPIAKVEAKIGDIYYVTFDAAMAAQGNDDVVLLVEKAITLDDEKAYTYTKGAYDVNVKYKRTLIAGIWNPVYLPFDFDLASDEFEVAVFTSAEGATVTLTKLEANEYGNIDLFANTAYVVRPIGENTTLDLGIIGLISKNEEKVQDLYNGFSVRGNYSKLTGADLEDNDRVVNGKTGNWGVLMSESYLKPFRLILSVPKDFTPEQSAAISMRVLDNTTGVEETIFDGQETIVIYDLMGRRVESITEGGIYIVNGKKIVF